MSSCVQASPILPNPDLEGPLLRMSSIVFMPVKYLAFLTVVLLFQMRMQKI